MLPSFSVSQLSDGTIDDGRVYAKANLEAAKARLKLFEVQLLQDQKLIDVHVAGAIGLSHLLEWKAVEHKRQLSAKGASLVEAHMDRHYQFQVSGTMDMLVGAIGGWLDTLKVTTKCTPLVLLIVDFNVPHTRDLTRITKLCQTIAGILTNAPDNGIGLIWAPDLAKQSTGCDASAEEEESVIVKSLAKFGTVYIRAYTQPVCMYTHPHAHVTGSTVPGGCSVVTLCSYACMCLLALKV